MQTVFIYRAANAIFGRVGRIASEEVIIYLIVTKCLPVLLYGLEACPLRKTDLNSLDFGVNRFIMKLFQTSNIDIVKCCQSHCCFNLPSVVHDRRAGKFDLRYRDHLNPFCQMISQLWMFVLLSLCLDIVDTVVVLYLYLVKLLLHFLIFFLLCYQLWWIKTNIHEYVPNRKCGQFI